MTHDNDSPNDILILPHQQKAFDRLTAMARAVIHTDLSGWPLSVRPNVFITGSSGSGKSFLARAVASSMNLAFTSVSASEWILLGCTTRGSSATWPSLCQFLLRNFTRDGCIIFLDEIDKFRLSGNGGTGGEWSRFALTEIYSLLDLRMPENLVDADGNQILDLSRKKAEGILRTKTLIIGAGAFQTLWDERNRRTIGFETNSPEDFENPNLNKLAEIVPRELINRFHSDLVILEPLVESDYHGMLEAIVPKLPEFWQSRFRTQAIPRIPEAVRLCQGPRFFEELLLHVIMAERQEISAPLKADSNIGLSI